ncbi:unnamed protein product [Oikopleura dioica]|uniref:Uncharacterized protein n=1 Tax=Oikopleura dioica TaxID=34765 RepID=E4YF01_OIKDI|nr:unnamed protein product [Oikopleura dioica]
MKGFKILLAGFLASAVDADRMSHSAHRAIKELHSHERMKITPIGGWSLGSSPQFYEFSHNRVGGSKAFGTGFEDGGVAMNSVVWHEHIKTWAVGIESLDHKGKAFFTKSNVTSECKSMADETFFNEIFYDIDGTTELFRLECDFYFGELPTENICEGNPGYKEIPGWIED